MSLDGEYLTIVATLNDGTATVSSGSTSTTVTHEVTSKTPDIEDIVVTPTSDLEGRNYWISDVGATTFKINISSQSLSTDYTFAWSVLNQ